MNQHRLEKFGLSLSLGMTLFMSVLGISFGIWIQSSAIMLDGFFNVVNCLMAAVTLWVAWLQKQPQSYRFHFGYFSFVPLVNCIKGLLIFTVSIFALFSAIATLVHGGQSLNASMAVVYAAIAATGCLFTAVTQNNLVQKTRSVMLQVDAKNWLINGLISLSVGIAFTIVALIKDTPWDWFIPYADSTIVTVLVLATIFIPIQIIIQSTKQLLLGAPNREIQKQIQASIENTIKNLPLEKYWLRITELGDTMFISVYCLLPQSFSIDNIQQLDYIRENVTEVLLQDYPRLIVDIIFTGDKKWAESVQVNDSN